MWVQCLFAAPPPPELASELLRWASVWKKTWLIPQFSPGKKIICIVALSKCSNRNAKLSEAGLFSLCSPPVSGCLCCIPLAARKSSTLGMILRFVLLFFCSPVCSWYMCPLRNKGLHAALNRSGKVYVFPSYRAWSGAAWPHPEDCVASLWMLEEDSVVMLPLL